jgi:hypothetical protein
VRPSVRRAWTAPSCSQPTPEETFLELTGEGHWISSNILLKLQVADRAQVVIRAREAEMGRDDAIRRAQTNKGK